MQYWQRYVAWFDKRKPREQVGVLLAGVALAFLVAELLLINPASTRQGSAKRELSRIDLEGRAVGAQLATLQAERAADPDAQNRQRAAQLRAQLADADGKLRTRSAELVPPDKIQSVLERLLSRNGRVELVELRTLPLSSLSAEQQGPAGAPAQAPVPPAAAPVPAAAAAGTAPAPDAAATGSAPLIYRHGVEVTLRGSYFDLLAYIKDVESLPLRVYWGRMDLNATRHPMNTIRLVVYTVSLDKAWLSV
jgi:MSHA biogenesis protein MshJ